MAKIVQVLTRPSEEYDLFTAIALALARVSTFCVDDETVNGPRDELA